MTFKSLMQQIAHNSWTDSVWISHIILPQGNAYLKFTNNAALPVTVEKIYSKEKLNSSHKLLMGSRSGLIALGSTNGIWNIQPNKYNLGIKLTNHPIKLQCCCGQSLHHQPTMLNKSTNGNAPLTDNLPQVMTLSGIVLSYHKIFTCVHQHYIPPSSLAIAPFTTSATQYYQATNVVLVCSMTIYFSINLNSKVD